MPIVEVEGVGRVQFPEGMSPEDMQRAIETEVIPQAQRLGRIDALTKSNPGEYDPNSPEFKAKYGATSGMGLGETALANIGAGFKNFGLGAAQLALPKSLERAVGITDESINEGRARDKELADNMVGGSLLQVAGEALPSLGIPGGAIARWLGAIPKLGGALGRAGVGTRALPTIAAESAVLGGAQGAITPTTSEDSVVGNAFAGTVAGGALPVGLAGTAKLGGTLGRLVLPSLQRKALSGKLGQTLDTGPQAQRELQSAIKASDRRVVDAPQSLATLTQDPRVAQLEMAARANPDTAHTWAQFDAKAGNARWKALHEALGSEETVKAAKDGTNAFARDVIPELFKGVNSKTLSTGVADFKTAIQGRLNSAVREADPARQEVYGYVAKAMDDGGGSPQMLWNIRKTLSDWIEGTPPPGKEGTRGAKMDKPILETREAIDFTLNQATKGRWSKFLTNYGERAQKESQQKAGQNIRNAFFDETLSMPRGATTAEGNPAVTRARLEQALVKHGKNDFGDALNYQQRNVVDQVLSDLRADEVLQRAKSAMTGKGGSQTAPLEALMKSTASRMTGGWLTELAGVVTGLSERNQKAMLNHILQSPQDALLIIQQAEKLKRPLTVAEKKLVHATRTLLASPSLLVSMNVQANAPSQ